MSDKKAAAAALRENSRAIRDEITRSKSKFGVFVQMFELYATAHPEVEELLHCAQAGNDLLTSLDRFETSLRRLLDKAEAEAEK